MKLPILFTFFSLFTSFTVLGQDLLISELTGESDCTLSDEDGDCSDWIEIYNNGDTEIDLFGYGLSDDLDDPFKWIFPAYSLEPQEHLLIFCSSKDRYTPAPYFHSNFKIDKVGESITLTNPVGVEVDMAPPIPCTSGFSVGRTCFTHCEFERLCYPSPGLANGSTSQLSFSHSSGFHHDPFSLSIQHSLGHTIHYTLDGSIPTTTSPVYDGPILMDASTLSSSNHSEISTSYNWSTPSDPVKEIHVIRASSFEDEERTSCISNRSFLVGEDHENDFSSLPVYSIMVEEGSFFNADTGIYVQGVNFSSSDVIWTGNYFQKGEEWEREGLIDYIDVEESNWSQSVGIRIHGGRSRGYPQKSLRIYSRGDKGASKFNSKLFRSSEKRVFDKFLLRTPNSCWNMTAFKDDVTVHLGRNLDFESQRSQLATVFLNGEYWGIHAVRDYFDHDYIAEEFPVEGDSVDILLHGSGTRPDLPVDWGIVHGNNDRYLSMLEFIENNSLSNSMNYSFVSELIDIPSIIDYYCYTTFFIKKDWPTGNHKVWSYRPDGKWRWLSYDFDSGWGYLGPGHNTVLHALHPTGNTPQNPEYATFLIRELLNAPAFKEAFLQRYACLLRNEFHVDTIHAALDLFEERYSPHMQDELARWNELPNQMSWEFTINSALRNFADQRHDAVIGHISQYFGIDFDPELYSCGVATSIDENLTEDTDVFAFPNPADSHLWLNLNESGGASEVKVFDVHGRLCHQLTSKGLTQVQTAHWEEGVYLIHVEVDSSISIQKIIVYH